jgi:hypothetical protein
LNIIIIYSLILYGLILGIKNMKGRRSQTSRIRISGRIGLYIRLIIRVQGRREGRIQSADIRQESVS